ncbi:MAG: helix-hairpin-helix domain-containing protein [Prolixibacteraceae bacterium]|nr:helix-hairpin-helix domain-containing protein [Prolixibacteraceae bacterium]
MKTITCISIFFFVFIISSAQETDKAKLLEALIESQLENIDEEANSNLLIEDLEYYSENPININSTTAAELSKLHILNDIQIENLLNYTNDFGPVYSIYELNTIDGFTPEILTKLNLFLSFGPREEKKQNFFESFNYGRHQLMLRTLGTIQNPKGYTANNDNVTPYEGNRFRYYSRYRFEAGNRFSAGITAEKDPGEAFFTGSNNAGFDFYSAHISANFNGFLQNVTVGDFIVRAGQGLVLWQGFTAGKSVYSLDISKTAQGVRPYTSVDENLFFRGISSDFKFGKARLTLFHSSKNSDGNISISEAGNPEFTSLQTSGYHRTTSEIEDERSVHRNTTGGVASYTFRYLKLGTTFVYENFNMPYAASNQLYQKYRFSGIQNYTAGLNYLFNKGKYQLFGEAAQSKSTGKAFLQGAIVNLTDQLGFSVLYRHFDKNYHALWANSFAEGSGISNESGLYFGTKILPVKYVTINAYSDFYRSEWINFSTAGPAQGWDILTQADFQFSEKLTFYFRFKNEEKEQKFSPDERYVNIPEKIKRIRFHIQLKPLKNIILKSRIESSGYSGLENENGLLIFQDVRFEPVNNPFKVTARFAWFSTDGYNSRIYAYEDDLLYTFSVPAYFYKGFRGYLNLKYNINEHLGFWLKLGHTVYNNHESISSGYNEIEGNKKTEIKFQLRLKI